MTSYVLIASLITVVAYINHIFILKKIKEDKNIVGSVILEAILIFILCFIVYSICSLY